MANLGAVGYGTGPATGGTSPPATPANRGQVGYATGAATGPGAADPTYRATASLQGSLSQPATLQGSLSQPAAIQGELG